MLFAAITPQLAWFGAALGLGWLAHIVGDCLTWQGAPLFAPFIFRPIRSPYGYRFKTGGTFECAVIRRLMKIWAIVAAAMFVYISL